MKNKQNKILPRFQKAPPMTEAEQAAHYERATREWGVETAAAAAAMRGVTLMVKGLEPPFYSVPYPEFQEQVSRRQEGAEVVPIESAADLRAGQQATQAMAELEPVEAAAS